MFGVPTKSLITFIKWENVRAVDTIFSKTFSSQKLSLRCSLVYCGAEHDEMSGLEARTPLEKDPE